MQSPSHGLPGIHSSSVSPDTASSGSISQRSSLHHACIIVHVPCRQRTKHVFQISFPVNKKLFRFSVIPYSAIPYSAFLQQPKFLIAVGTTRRRIHKDSVSEPNAAITSKKNTKRACILDCACAIGEHVTSLPQNGVVLECHRIVASYYCWSCQFADKSGHGEYYSDSGVVLYVN